MLDSKLLEETTLSDGTKLSELANFEDRRVSARVLSDPDIYKLELERIFYKVWVPVAHESEIPNKGDYVIRHIGEDKVIVTRGENDQIHIMLNGCPHRGAELCRADLGNTSHFRCPYHGWTFKLNGQLNGVPARKEAYGNQIDYDEYHLVKVRSDSYQGLIFGTFNEEAPPLSEQLGDMKWYLDIILKHTDNGMEVLGSPQRWKVKASWKSAMDNFIGDSYHTFMAHASVVKTRIVPTDDPKFSQYGAHISTGNGSGLGMVSGPPPGFGIKYYGLPEEMHAEIERNLTEGQAEAMRTTAINHGAVFPNLSFGHFTWVTEDGGEPGSFVTMALYVPTGPDEMEVWKFCLVEKDAPDWWKEHARKQFVRTFGASGAFEPDDAEIWKSIMRASKGYGSSRELTISFDMGSHKEPDHPDWPGPGTVYNGDYNEANQLGFWKHYFKLLSQK